MPCKYEVEYLPFFPYYCTVGIFGLDGSIAVTHGGQEMGQGINTKVAQIVAKTLNGPTVDMISIKPTNNNFHPNNTASGGSVTSEMTCHVSSVVRQY